MEKALEDKILFYVSKNSVILSPGIDGIIDPKYFKLVYDKTRKALIQVNEINDELEQKQQKL